MEEAMATRDIVFGAVAVIALVVLAASNLSPYPHPLLSNHVQWGILLFLVAFALAATRWISS
jgi:uncharacterized PurR-regulated membrane protein YhhQ (DUF165 family)